MKTTLTNCLGFLLVPLLTAPLFATERFVSGTGANAAPFTSWADAATNIQDAIDVASAGDVVWVTNGVYSVGGKVMAGNLTNRVALDKALTVQSVNGPFVTCVQGAGATNGTAAVRCAWLTNGAVLKGFTLQGGATRTTGDSLTLRSGGGVWCASASAVVANCVVRTNAAGYGGGAYQGTLQNCALVGNTASSSVWGGGAESCVLNSCTVCSNLSGGTTSCTLTNCTVYFNFPYGNYNNGTFSFCCTTPLPSSGKGNISADPQLLGDGIHLASTSPCRGKGTNVVSGTDIDGQPWANPPGIGCDEWLAAPVFAVQPRIQFAPGPTGVTIGAVVAGQEPFTCWWTRDGAPLEDDGHYSSTHTANLVVNPVGLLDGGGYQVVVSNAFGMATSAVAQLVFHYVNAAGLGPVAPYLSWDTAATTIQDAIDAAQAGEFVWVTNGVYATGGKVMASYLTNRVALDKVLMVQSVNGPTTTFIQGTSASYPTNGPLAVRCAWLTNGAVLSGFTLRGGATRDYYGDVTTLRCGGGAWCASASATIANSIIISNVANDAGGGVYQGNLRNCALIGNKAGSRGAAYNSVLNSCTVSGNAYAYGAVYQCLLTNCIVYNNASPNANGGTFSYCCTTPLPSGAGNISADPQLSDGIHVTSGSPCRGAGSNLVNGTDLDGQPWANPPSIGCDEWLAAPAFSRQPTIQFSRNAFGLSVGVGVVGQEPFSYWWTKDGVSLENDEHYSSAHTANLFVAGISPLDAGSYQVVVSNAFGMTTGRVTRLPFVFHYVDAAGRNSVPPYSSWATAATRIQEAIDVALEGEIVLVTNGVYAAGGKVMAGDLTNRVALTKPMAVSSANGPDATIIQGASAPGTGAVNGPEAVRCAWLGDNAVLYGFTLQGGGTRTSGDSLTLQSGGGVWAYSESAAAVNCVISNNAAYYSGGGCYQGSINRCWIVENKCHSYGGGAYLGFLRNCAVLNNEAFEGGGSDYGSLINCSVLWNKASFGGGVYGGWPVQNCIVYYNTSANWSFSGGIEYTCTTPLPSVGSNNIAADPLTLNGIHLRANSPCRGAGSAAYLSGTDFDGEVWTNPPSMGCDQVWESALNGPLSVSATSLWPEVTQGRALSLIGQVTGRANRVDWSLEDGVVLTNACTRIDYAWTNPGDYTATFTAFNADNPAGVSTELVVHVLPLIVPTLTTGGWNGNSFTLSFPGQPGVTYVVQQTTNLTPPVAWERLASLSSTGSLLQVTDTKATNAARFYRVQVQ